LDIPAKSLLEAATTGLPLLLDLPGNPFGKLGRFLLVGNRGNIGGQLLKPQRRAVLLAIREALRPPSWQVPSSQDRYPMLHRTGAPPGWCFAGKLAASAAWQSCNVAIGTSS